MTCQHEWEFSSYCEAHICYNCGLHAHVRKDGTVSQELARCYCGWNLAPGERLEDDVDDY